MVFFSQAAEFVQNSTCQVLSEGCLKAVGRPTFTLLDKTATKEERKYSATKELLYQSFSMAAFFALIFPIKRNTYKLLKFFPQLKDCDVINARTAKEYQEKLKQVTDKKMLTKIKGANELMSIIASGIILAHNHPGGLAIPSDDDLNATRIIQEALMPMDIVVRDHIIIAGNDFVSLKDSNMMQYVSTLQSDVERRHLIYRKPSRKCASNILDINKEEH